MLALHVIKCTGEKSSQMVYYHNPYRVHLDVYSSPDSARPPTLLGWNYRGRKKNHPHTLLNTFPAKCNKSKRPIAFMQNPLDFLWHTAEHHVEYFCILIFIGGIFTFSQPPTHVWIIFATPSCQLCRPSLTTQWLRYRASSISRKDNNDHVNGPWLTQDWAGRPDEWMIGGAKRRSPRDSQPKAAVAEALDYCKSWWAIKSFSINAHFTCGGSSVTLINAFVCGGCGPMVYGPINCQGLRSRMRSTTREENWAI